MLKESKDRRLIILIIIALIQGPILYYFTEGVSDLILTIIFGLSGLILTTFLLRDMIRHRSTTKPYHIIGLSFAVLLGLVSIRGDLIEYLDFNLRKSERNEIVDQIRKGKLKSEHISDDSIFALSRGGDILIKENTNGIVSIEFYIDRGFLDNQSAFLYTNDPYEIRDLESEGPKAVSSVKKLDTNWYRVAY